MQFLWTMLPVLLLWPGLCGALCCSMVASMAWTLWCLYGLNYVFACACFNDTSIGHCAWNLILCSDLSPTTQWVALHAKECVAGIVSQPQTIVSGIKWEAR
jgi:hypothetical protein